MGKRPRRRAPEHRLSRRHRYEREKEKKKRRAAFDVHWAPSMAKRKWREKQKVIEIQERYATSRNEKPLL